MYAAEENEEWRSPSRNLSNGRQSKTEFDNHCSSVFSPKSRPHSRSSVMRFKEKTGVVPRPFGLWAEQKKTNKAYGHVQNDQPLFCPTSGN